MRESRWLLEAFERMLIWKSVQEQEASDGCDEDIQTSPVESEAISPRSRAHAAELQVCAALYY